VVTPLVTMTDHTDAVTSVEWSKQQDHTIVSGGNDAFVRLWDSRTATNTLSLVMSTSSHTKTHLLVNQRPPFLTSIFQSCEKALNGLSVSPATGLIATGHIDNTVRVWDPRVQEGVVVKMTLSSHTGWVTATAWAPVDTFNIVSASHDKTLKVWDIRSSTPLHTITAHEGKVLAVDWVKDMVLSGGTDNKLKMFKVSLPKK